MRPHIAVVFGTRPEAIKMMPLVSALRCAPNQFKVTVIVTGQHREMLDQVFTAFGERADIDLNLMSHAQTLSALTAGILTNSSETFQRLKPDLVLVQGDTTTALSAAIAAFYLRVKVGHVEAGLRSLDLQRPWPEEFNRVAIDAFADYMFAPTISARDHLISEYNKSGHVYVTGNTGIDALLMMAAKLDADLSKRAKLAARYDISEGHRLVLVTGHRRESFGVGFQSICDGLSLVAERDDVHIIYPVHLNPNVRNVVHSRLAGRPNIRLIDPIEYTDMVFLMQEASVIVTDSGGIQEEAPALGRPVLVMRDVTERPEALATGNVKLIGTNPEVMRREVDLLLDDAVEYSTRSKPSFPYGDGTAAAQIVNILNRELCVHG